MALVLLTWTHSFQIQKQDTIFDMPTVHSVIHYSIVFVVCNKLHTKISVVVCYTCLLGQGGKP
jgi:hypothetical protein